MARRSRVLSPLARLAEYLRRGRTKTKTPLQIGNEADVEIINSWRATVYAIATAIQGDKECKIIPLAS
jgi:hypothetical protein